MGFPRMVPACGVTEAGAAHALFGQAVRPPVVEVCVLLANGGNPRLHLPIGKDYILWIS